VCGESYSFRQFFLFLGMVPDDAEVSSMVALGSVTSSLERRVASSCKSTAR
jgi:hypothetical protein